MKRHRRTLITLPGKFVWTCSCIFSWNPARPLTLQSTRWWTLGCKKRCSERIFFSFLADSRRRRRSCFPLTFGGSSIATCYQWSRIHFGKLWPSSWLPAKIGKQFAMERSPEAGGAVCPTLPESQTRDAEDENRATWLVFDTEWAKTCLAAPCQCPVGVTPRTGEGPRALMDGELSTKYQDCIHVKFRTGVSEIPAKQL